MPSFENSEGAGPKQKGMVYYGMTKYRKYKRLDAEKRQKNETREIPVVKHHSQCTRMMMKNMFEIDDLFRIATVQLHLQV